MSFGRFIQQFLNNYFILLIVAIGLIIALTFRSAIDRRKAIPLLAALLTVLVLAVVDQFEFFFEESDHYEVGRLITSFLGYCLRPIVIYLVLLLVMKEHKKIYLLLSIPAVINIIIFSTSFYAPNLSFSFDELNHFHGGPLRYSAFVISYIYLGTLLYFTFVKFSRTNKEEAALVAFMALSIAVCSILESKEIVTATLNNAIAIALAFFYLYLHLQVNKIDPLTGLLNRKSFFNDCLSYKDKITGVISLDLNCLKEINDNKGHETGDNALKTIAELIEVAVSYKCNAYRIGGDEFEILILKKSEGYVKDIVSKLEGLISISEYKAAVGYSFKSSNETIDQLLSHADKMMYKNKANMKGVDYENTYGFAKE